MTQEDIFLRGTHARLKLRRLSDASAHFLRSGTTIGPTRQGPPRRTTLVSTSEPDRLRALLAAAYGIMGVVRKRRTVRMVGRTRVHLDEVEDLGRFIELEVVLDAGEPIERGLAEARRLMVALDIQEGQLVSQAPIDLLQETRSLPAR